jgi:hypothetical protein
MIDVMDIMKQIEHMETNTPEQREEMQKEAFRLIKERENEHMRILEENHVAFMERHDAIMLNLAEKRRLSRERHESYMMEHRLHIQESPKRQIYFGKVKTE